MGMEEALLVRLREAPALEPRFGDRWDWYDRPRIDDAAPGETIPAGSLTIIDPGEEWTHDGPDGLNEARVRFEIWSRDKATLVACKRLVIAEMRQLRERRGWCFHEASLELERTDIDPGEAGSEKLFRVTLDFLFLHEELPA
jgi:hypothetical protein